MCMYFTALLFTYVYSKYLSVQAHHNEIINIYLLFISYDENDDQSDAIVQQKFLPGVK